MISTVSQRLDDCPRTVGTGGAAKVARVPRAPQGTNQSVARAGALKRPVIPRSRRACPVAMGRIGVPRTRRARSGGVEMTILLQLKTVSREELKSVQSPGFCKM